eukprot:TRINITY_DN79482_c0_g1_i1.p1 TRINITY_DN79482_c0_g1~~TRINITY_DN79482_c0_g1_i1.p1  ORF type:complete len:592 (+),score=59.40 TRINITY_DN79482_c0_g1_i1:3-1778(+)
MLRFTCWDVYGFDGLQGLQPLATILMSVISVCLRCAAAAACVCVIATFARTVHLGNLSSTVHKSSKACSPAAPRDVDVVIIGAGYAGLAAAKHISDNSKLTVHILEAQDRVGGRVRNFDLKAGVFDVASDDVVEVGGTFISPGHTALIDFAHSLGVGVYNGSQWRKQGHRVDSLSRLTTPPQSWSWWYWGVDSAPGPPGRSVYHGLSNGKGFFATPSQLNELLPAAVFEELQVAGQKLFAEANKISCEVGDSMGGADGDLGAWYEEDSITFEGWIRQHVQHEEGRKILRAMTRGMIAQEAQSVSFLSILKSLKGCWSAGDDDQYRMRGGTQAPLLKVAELLSHELTLSSPVRSVTAINSSESSSKQFEVVSDRGTFIARKVIVTGPPPVLAGISFLPPLHATQAQLLQRMPMGTSLKFFAVYERPWWRDSNFSGLIMSSKTTNDGDSFDCCQEHSPFASTKAALMCWIEGEANLRFLSSLDEKERLQHVMDFLHESFNVSEARVLKPDVVAYNWADNPWARGAYTGYFAPGVQSQPELWQAYKDGEWMEGLFIAGADWIPGYGNGYMEGAVRSGQTAARAVMASMSPRIFA